MEHFYSLLIAVLLDQLIGEFSVAHPLVGFGNLANQVEACLNRHARNDLAEASLQKKLLGILAVVLLIVPFVSLAIFTSISLKEWSWIFDGIMLYFAIGARSLVEHSNDVATALKNDDLPAARISVAKIVSRDTSTTPAPAAARATIESVLENGNDAVFAPIFWFLLLGAPGAVLLRLSNTLDAMWGYKNSRYLSFGWAAARLDDVLMYVPARLTALTYSLCGHCKDGLKCWQTQGSKWYSPNAGPVMAAGAGALGVCLGGDSIYGGKLKERLQLGCGKEPDGQDIDRANRLIWRSIVLWLVLVFLIELLSHA